MLNEFTESVLDQEDLPITSNLPVYRMDGNPGMREKAKLGPCSCCDYLVIGNDFVLFIEETNLLQQIEGIKNEVSYLNSDDKERFVREKVLHENRSKVYGAMLVLCRLAREHQNLRGLIGNKVNTFWLVVRGEIRDEDRMYFDSLRHRLENAFRGELSKLVFKSVKVLALDDLKVKLSCMS